MDVIIAEPAPRFVPLIRIGHNLTLCLADIANGKVRLEEVAYILASVPYRDLDHMLETIAEWRVGRVDRNLQIARLLWESGRIFIPSMTLTVRNAPVWQTVEANAADRKVVSLGDTPSQRSQLASALRSMTFTSDQRTAFEAMTSGKSALIVGASKSGRSSLAALAAVEWDRDWQKHEGKALVVCTNGRAAMEMRNLGVENVLTYEEIDEFDAAETLNTLGRYRLFIFDDYDPAWGQVADMCVDGGLLSPSRQLPVIRIADRSSVLEQSADVILATRMRVA